LDDDDVWSEFGYWMFSLWADAKPLVDRVQKDDPAVHGNLSDLMERLRKIDLKEHDGKLSHPSADDIRDFYQGEVELPPDMPTPRRHAKK
jgi:hypothetical protein